MDVASLYQQLFFTTFYIQTYRDIITSKGQEQQSWTGTGFFFDYYIGNTRIPMLVTNRHVVEGFDKGALRFIESIDGITPTLGKSITFNFDNFQSLWHFHNDINIDIAVMSFAGVLRQLDQAKRSIFYRALDTSIVPSDEQIMKLNAIEDVIFVGYPRGIFDLKNLLPIARRGVTATPPQVDYNGLPTFVIDASVFPGSSGSPVLVANEGGYLSPQGVHVGSRAFFLGVLASGHFSTEKGRIVIEEMPTVNTPISITRQFLNLGIVFKSRSVIETIEDFIRTNQPNLLNTIVEDTAGENDSAQSGDVS